MIMCRVVKAVGPNVTEFQPGDSRPHVGGVDYSFEAIGMSEMAWQAFECLRGGHVTRSVLMFG